MTKLLVAGLLGVGMLAAAQEPGPKAVLVELFTSEGCSSCPPADALLRKLNGTVSEGTLIVGLSEHVTYWNSLGWRDPFSQELFTGRQRDYGERFKLRSVYTPQVVVNGVREVLGSDEQALRRAVAETGRTSANVIRIEGVARDGDSLRVTYRVSGNVAGAAVWAVVAEDVATTEVPRGENAGHKLTHVAVARSMAKLGGVKTGGSQSAVVALPGGSSARHLVLFVQEAGQGRVLGVDSKEL